MIERILSRFSPRLVLALALAWMVAPAASRADVTVYNNINSIVGFQPNGGAISATGNTALLADDITFLAGYSGFKATSFTLAVGNSGSTTETANVTAEFFATDGTGGGPGTLLGSSTITNVAFASGVTTEVFTAASLFAIPANGKIWAGFYFTGVSGSTLNNLGVENEENLATMSPTVGSSTPSYFSGGTTPASTGANPSGSILTNTSTGQNFGITIAVPEPSSVLLTVTGFAGLAGLIARRRKKD